MARTSPSDPATRLADDYLERLAAACRASKVNKRRAAGLIAQASRRFADAREANPHNEAAGVLGVISALGEPEDYAVQTDELSRVGRLPGDVAAAAAAERSAPRGRRRDRSASDASAPEVPVEEKRPRSDDVELGWAESFALLGITVGWLAPGPGWLIGAAGLLVSRRWAWRDKLAVLVLPWLIVALPAASLLRKIYSTDPYVSESITAGSLVLPGLVALVAFAAAGTWLWLRLQPKAKPAAR